MEQEETKEFVNTAILEKGASEKWSVNISTPPKEEKKIYRKINILS